MQIVPAVVKKLSQLEIDADKSWVSKNISSLGSGNINLGVNQPLSPGLYVEDIGKTWIDLGVISSAGIISMLYCGNGIVLLGDDAYHVFRSIDYGKTWSDLGVISANAVPRAMCYCGSGIVLFGSSNKHVFRSTDYGVTWTDLGVITPGAAYSMIYCGNGIAFVGDASGYIYKSTDYGATWSDSGAIASGEIRAISYCGDGIVVAAETDKHILRSTDYGATWSDLGVISSGYARSIAYCDNGIVLFGDSVPSIYRSTDYGLTWTEAAVGVIAFHSIAYCGNGIVLLGNATFGDVYRSTDYGETWVKLAGAAANSLNSMIYCGNGVTLLGSSNKHVYVSECSYKSDENALDCVPKPINIMTFWSDVDALVTLPADTALPNIVIADIPSGATVIRAILMLKYSAKKDTSASDNQITAGKITSKETTGGTYVDAINLINGEAKVTASTKEGGDVHPGDNDISGATSDIIGNCTVQSVFAGVTTTGASIELYDVQVGIRVYFT